MKDYMEALEVIRGIEGIAGKAYWLDVLVKQGLSCSIAGRILLTLRLL